MNIHYYIIIKNRRNLRFDKATAFDAYVKSHKLPKGAIIQLQENNKIVGEMLVETYLEFEKLEKLNDN